MSKQTSHNVSGESRRFRPEIQGLRALAVALVVCFHIWPELLPGGYVGVDVFFVISGFLITGHLLAEIARTETLDLKSFWARRIRRLLPAAYLVLGASILITFAFAPTSDWQETFRQISASSIYMQNWLLAASSVSYFAVDNDPTLVQHYWSLSIEEQFYILWPLLILLIIRLTNFVKRRRIKKSSEGFEKLRLQLAVGLSIILFSSLGWSIYAAHFTPGSAYFSTWTRAWEFSLGGLLNFYQRSAVGLAGGCQGDRLWTATGWFGVATICTCAYAFSATTIFPGYIALVPTLGTALVILSEQPANSLSWAKLSESRLVGFLGDTSYSTYLWHWPLVVAFPFVLGRRFEPIEGLWVALATILLAAATRALVEDPLRHQRSWLTNVWQAFFFALAGMLGVVAVCSFGWALVQHRRDLAWKESAPYNSVVELKTELSQTLMLDSWPAIDHPPGQEALPKEWMIDGCLNVVDRTELGKCQYGNRASSRTILVIGDSWALHFMPAIREAFGSDWRIQAFTLGQCPLADVRVHQWHQDKEYQACNKHRAAVFEYIRESQPTLIIASDSAYSTQMRLLSGAKGVAALKEMYSGTRKSYARLQEFGFPVLVLESPPRSNCTVRLDRNPRRCTASETTKFQRRLSEVRIEAANSVGLPVLDTTFWFCSETLVCPQQIGKSLTKADPGHISGTFSRRLGLLMRNAASALLANQLRDR